MFGDDSNPRLLTIASTTDIGIIKPLIEAYRAAHPVVSVRYRELTTTALFTQAQKRCREGSPENDIVFSSAMDLQVKLVNDGCAASIYSAGLDTIPAHARWRDQLFGLTYEPAVIVYNKTHLSAAEVPADHFDLLDLLRQPGRFDGKVGTYDIEASGLGYLFATLDDQRSSTWGRLIEAMGRNSVRLYCCTAQILDEVADGTLSLGYNVLGSYALAHARTHPDLGIVIPGDYALVLTRAAFVPKGAHNVSDAVAFLGFTQSSAGRQILNEEALLFSPVDGAQKLYETSGLDAEANRSLHTIDLSPALIVGLDSMKRRLFLKQWKQSLGQASD